MTGYWWSAALVLAGVLLVLWGYLHARGLPYDEGSGYLWTVLVAALLIGLGGLVAAVTWLDQWWPF